MLIQLTATVKLVTKKLLIANYVRLKNIYIYIAHLLKITSNHFKYEQQKVKILLKEVSEQK